MYGYSGPLLLPAGFLQVHRPGATLAAIAVQASHRSGFSCYPAPSTEHRLRSRGARVRVLRGRWDLPGPGIEPLCPALAVGFLTTRRAEKPRPFSYWWDRSKNFQAPACRGGTADPGSQAPACCVLQRAFPCLHSGPQHRDCVHTAGTRKEGWGPWQACPHDRGTSQRSPGPRPPSSGPQTTSLLRGQTAQHAGKQPGGDRGLEPSAL